jgi:alpha-beta hydrolase superfamily lysophospholipase
MEHSEGWFQGLRGARLYYQRWRPAPSPGCCHACWWSPIQFRIPLLLLIGGADRLALPSASKAYFARVGSPDKELREYPGAYTNLLSETVTPEVLGDLDRWLERHVS